MRLRHGGGIAGEQYDAGGDGRTLQNTHGDTPLLKVRTSGQEPERRIGVGEDRFVNFGRIWSLYLKRLNAGNVNIGTLHEADTKRLKPKISL
jgi:hypothetical protein